MPSNKVCSEKLKKKLNNNTTGYNNPHCFQHLRIEGYHSSTTGIVDDLNPTTSSNSHVDDNNLNVTMKPYQEQVSNQQPNLNKQDIFNECEEEESMKLDSKNHLSFKEAQAIVSKLYSACSGNPNLHVVVSFYKC